jgi:hypothetical protein
MLVVSSRILRRLSEHLGGGDDLFDRGDPRPQATREQLRVRCVDRLLAPVRLNLQQRRQQLLFRGREKGPLLEAARAAAIAVHRALPRRVPAGNSTLVYV